MRLSLMKGAHVVLEDSVQEIRVSRPLLARCGNPQISPWKSSGTICTVARAFVPSHIWPKPGQIWGTLIGGTETFPALVLYGWWYTSADCCQLNCATLGSEA